MKRCKICGVIMSMFHSTLVGNCSARLKKLKMEDFYDYEILEMAMDNTYNLIMGDSTLQDFLNEGQDFMPFLCDPYNPSKKDIKNLLEYFEEKEEYEKCSNLLNHIKEK